MARRKTPQMRMGKKEAALFGQLVGLVKKYKVFQQYKSDGETRFNDRLMDYLRQNNILVRNKNIHAATFVGERFRPECFLPGTGKYPICAIECKKLTDRFAKARWKEGLSQSLIYKHTYKSVVYVLYDFTKHSKYAIAFGRGNRSESRFAKRLRENNGVYIIVLRPAPV